MARGRAMACLGMLAILVAGCGAEAPKGSKGPPVPQAGTVKVGLTDMKIDPATPTIEKPGEVRFRVRNSGQKTHALRIEGPTTEVETQDLRPGQAETLSADLNRPGEYKWFCPYHRAEGMTGTISVRGA